MEFIGKFIKYDRGFYIFSDKYDPRMEYSARATSIALAIEVCTTCQNYACTCK